MPYTPEQNGVAERANRSIIEKTRTLLHEGRMDKRFWGEAVNTAIHFLNLSPTRSLRTQVPEQVWTGKDVDLSGLRVFGCSAYVHIPKEKRLKLDAKSKELFFVGYCSDTKGYRLADAKGALTKARDVVFIENRFPASPKSKEQTREQSEEVEIQLNAEAPAVAPEIRLEDEVSEASTDYDTPMSDDQYDSDESGEQEQQREVDEGAEDAVVAERRYPVRERKRREFPDHVMYSAKCSESEPSSVTQALSFSNKARDKWMRAMHDELESLKENDVWDLCDLPAGKKAVQNKWLFKLKKDSDGNVVKHKARLVAKGFTQKYGVDYMETFSPVVRGSTLRMLFAMAVENDWEIDHWDVTTAFLYGKLQDEVYMVQPEGMVIPEMKDKVCKLKKALYGLKQASRVWNQEVDNVLTRQGFTQCQNESCVYTKSKEDCKLLVAIFVDDFFIFGNDHRAKESLKSELTNCFKMKDMGGATQILGMRVRREEGEIYLHQRRHIQEVLAKFGMSDCKPVSTPLEPGSKFEKGDNDTPFPYQCLVGCLMYVAINTRPDIAHALSVLSQFNTCYSEEHVTAAKRVLRYLKGTINDCLVFKKSKDESEVIINGYVDADWGNDNNDRKSYTGYVFKLGGNVISWESRKQQSVALSSTEAEYMSLTEGAKEAIYLCN